ncbi:hypothetical protein Tco_1011775 [Tanacetum coccineum]
MFAHDSGTNVDNRGSKIPLNMHPLHGDSSSIEISLTQTADSLAHEQQHGTIDIPSQRAIVGPTSTLSGTISFYSVLQQFPLNKGNIPFTPDAHQQKNQSTMHQQHNIIPNVHRQKNQTTMYQQQMNQTHIHQSQPHHQQQCLSDTEPEGIPNPKNIRPRSETPNESRTIIPYVYSKKSSHLCANNRPLLQMFTDKETKQLRTNNRRMRPKQPQPGFQRLRSSDNKPARICDPKSIRPRYETVTGFLFSHLLHLWWFLLQTIVTGVARKAGLRPKITQELNELREVSAMINSCLENINHTQIKIPSPVPVEQLFNNFMDSLNILEIDDLESDTPLVSPFWIMMMGQMMEVVAYFDPFLLMNIITRKAYNTIMVEGLESKGRNLVSIVRNVYVFVGSFTYVMDFVVLEDIREFIVSDMSEVVMGRPFRVVAQLEYNCVKGLISFTRIYDTYIFRMSRTIPRLKNFEWSPEYQVDENMKEWLTRGHMSIEGVTCVVIFDKEKPKSS